MVLAVVGRNWAGRDTTVRRIDDPADHVRVELVVALEGKAPIIPVLIDDAEIPADLPSELAELRFRNGIRVRVDPDFQNDLGKLLAEVREHSDLHRLDARPPALERVGEVQPRALGPTTMVGIAPSVTPVTLGAPVPAKRAPVKKAPRPEGVALPGSVDSEPTVAIGESDEGRDV